MRPPIEAVPPSTRILWKRHHECDKTNYNPFLAVSSDRLAFTGVRLNVCNCLPKIRQTLYTHIKSIFGWLGPGVLDVVTRPSSITLAFSCHSMGIRDETSIHLVHTRIVHFAWAWHYMCTNRPFVAPELHYRAVGVCRSRWSYFLLTLYILCSTRCKQPPAYATNPSFFLLQSHGNDVCSKKCIHSDSWKEHSIQIFCRCSLPPIVLKKSFNVVKYHAQQSMSWFLLFFRRIN